MFNIDSAVKSFEKNQKLFLETLKIQSDMLCNTDNSVDALAGQQKHLIANVFSDPQFRATVNKFVDTNAGCVKTILKNLAEFNQSFVDQSTKAAKTASTYDWSRWNDLIADKSK